MKQASLELSEEKTKIIPFGRFKRTKETFDFLGFTFSNGTTRTGKYTVNKRTSKKKMKQKKVRRSQKAKKYRQIIDKILKYRPLPLPKLYVSIWT